MINCSLSDALHQFQNLVFFKIKQETLKVKLKLFYAKFLSLTSMSSSDSYKHLVLTPTDT
jgi:hypothetical protein